MSKKKLEDLPPEEIFERAEEELVEQSQTARLLIYHLMPGTHREARAVALVAAACPVAEA